MIDGCIPEEENRYRVARLRKGLSQEDLSAACGVDARTIRKLEQGTAVSSRTLRLVAGALDVPVDASTIVGISMDGRSSSTGGTEAPKSMPVLPDDGSSSTTPGDCDANTGGAPSHPGAAITAVVMFVSIIGVFLVWFDGIETVRQAKGNMVEVEIAYPSDGGRTVAFVTSLQNEVDVTGYHILLGDTGATVARDGRTDTLAVGLLPIACPKREDCDERIRTAAFDDFSRRMVTQADVLRVTRR